MMMMMMMMMMMVMVIIIISSSIVIIIIIIIIIMNFRLMATHLGCQNCIRGDDDDDDDGDDDDDIDDVLFAVSLSLLFIAGSSWIKRTSWNTRTTRQRCKHWVTSFMSEHATLSSHVILFPTCSQVIPGVPRCSKVFPGVPGCSIVPYH